MVDSGCSNHMVGSIELLEGYREMDEVKIQSANGHMLKAIGMGTVRGRNVELSNVWYVPGISESLLSVQQLASKGHKVRFTKSRLIIELNNGDRIQQAKAKDGFYYLTVEMKKGKAMKAKLNELQRLHRACGHIGETAMRAILKQIGETYSKQPVCEICEKARGVTKPYSHKRKEGINGPQTILSFDIVKDNLVGHRRMTSRTVYLVLPSEYLDWNIDSVRNSTFWESVHPLARES